MFYIALIKSFLRNGVLMKYFLLGGWFIGGNFIHYFIKNKPNCEIVCLDKLTYAGNLSTLNCAFQRSTFKFVQIDITDRSSIFSCLKRITRYRL
jgi:dTDP-glucose 4,6-dehydratase